MKTATAILSLALTWGSWAQPTPERPEAATTGVHDPLPRLKDLIRPRDRVLFVGDELTQQMFYTRAVAAALLAIMPESDLRFFNGGREGATTRNVRRSLDELITLCQPTVVFLCFGLNQTKQPMPAETVIEAFRQSLSDRIDQVKATPTVRQVVVVSAPPVTDQPIRPPADHSDNWMLSHLARAARTAAARHGALFVDLFEPMADVYLAAARSGGSPLTHDNRLPTESGHVVIASVLLRGMGVSGEQLDAVGWSPLPPIQMRRIRPVLAVPVHAPDLDTAERSRAIYLSMGPFDEAFFRLWRLSNRNPSRTPKQTQRSAMHRAWRKVKTAVKPTR